MENKSNCQKYRINVKKRNKRRNQLLPPTCTPAVYHLSSSAVQPLSAKVKTNTNQRQPFQKHMEVICVHQHTCAVCGLSHLWMALCHPAVMSWISQLTLVHTSSISESTDGYSHMYTQIIPVLEKEVLHAIEIVFFYIIFGVLLCNRNTPAEPVSLQISVRGWDHQIGISFSRNLSAISCWKPEVFLLFYSCCYINLSYISKLFSHLPPEGAVYTTFHPLLPKHKMYICSPLAKIIQLGDKLTSFSD